MSVIILILAFLTVFMLERKIKLRHKYQVFSSKFTIHYIDFPALISLAVIGVFIVYLFSLTPLSDYAIEYIREFYITYTLIIILPD
ncbi:MAG: hypothetical protein K0R50_1376 [Eubacterium sp.]|jgi:hypothetical protein|nr:hypothetical protein [Eubacterium sp.]